MEAMSIPEKIVLRSALRNYEVDFVNDVFETMSEGWQTNWFAIVDKVIVERFGDALKRSLPSSAVVVVDATESHKSYDFCGSLIQELLQRKVRKNTRIVAVGGGVTQDIAAFCASIIFRGVEWAFVPTTLLAQADSCIGGKTSINVGEVKNTLGNFYPPWNIYIDLSFLESLPLEDIKSGIGEILHFYYYANSPLTDLIYRDYDRLLTNRSLLRPYIVESLRIKQSVIEIDEFDKGERNKFNYGHTFGHALESTTHYAVKHGQAVTVGMDIANMISCSLGLMDESLYRSIRMRLRTNFPDYDLCSINVETFVGYLSKDKKNLDDELVCILAEAPGKLVKKKIPMDREFRNRIGAYFSEMHSDS
jgi:3-dehydroquinate synthase